uniref:Uncharacterized protein n=1 Tax=Mammaliicoccus phage MSShimriz1 TaxID=3230127 RepID=A0AAU8GVK0_9VIRU
MLTTSALYSKLKIVRKTRQVQANCTQYNIRRC